jgi:CRISPR-associated protein Cas2
MLVLITYDVNITSIGGKRRLRKIAKTCLDYGMRVQHSVFECEVDPDRFVKLKNELVNIYDPESDSLRFYFLGKRGRQKVEHVGTKIIPDALRDAIVL